MSFNFASFSRLSGHIVSFGFGVWIALAGPALTQGRLAVSGTTVSLVPAVGFVAATGFSGLQNPQTQASLVVAEMPPVAHDQVSKLFETLDAAKTNFAKQNVLVQTIEQIDIAGDKAPLITGTQDVAGTRFDKWILLIKGGRTVIIVSYQLSGRVAADKLQATAEELLKTTQGFDTASVESRQAVSFAGRDGTVLAGNHTSPSGAAKRFAHYMAIGESARYLRMIVSAHAAQFDALQPAIKAIVDSAAFADRP